MSQQLIARNQDLALLQSEGYAVEVIDGVILIHDVPCVTSSRAIERGTLVSTLNLAGDSVSKPDTHVAYWIGQHPCNRDGSVLQQIVNSSARTEIKPSLFVDHMFSAKADYRDYHHKMTTYIACITGEAAILDPTVTARTFRAVLETKSASPFHYVDTATLRSGTAAANTKIEGQRIAIIGIGGTGSYVLDFAAKTSAAEIHIFDGDVFLQHNAFRAPGASSISDISANRSKVEHFTEVYSAMRKGIVPHPIFLRKENISFLNGFDFVFVCIDQAEPKKLIVQHLLAASVPFVEVGMGLTFAEGKLTGIVRSSLVTPANTAKALPHVSFSEENAANEYMSNVQMVEMNALNAVFAITAWKRHFGFYADINQLHYTGYSIATGEVVTEGLLNENEPLAA